MSSWTSALRIQCVWSQSLGPVRDSYATLSQERQSFHVLIALEMAMLIIVDSCGILVFIDSHIHGTKGAVIARFNPDSHCQAQNFAVWLDQMLIHTKGVGLNFIFMKLLQQKQGKSLRLVKCFIRKPKFLTYNFFYTWHVQSFRCVMDSLWISAVQLNF